MRTLSRTDVVVDLFAVQADGGGRLDAVPAERVVDTRGSGGPVAAGTPLAVDTGVPPGASGVFANLTIVGASAPTFAATFPRPTMGRAQPPTGRARRTSTSPTPAPTPTPCSWGSVARAACA